MAKAWAEARGACTTGDITLWNGDLAYVPIPIGPIVLVLVPHLDVSVNASVAAEGRLRVEAAAGIKAAAVAKVGLKGGSITGEGPTFDAWSNFDSYAAAVADAHATVRLSMLLYKLAGPYMQATVGLRGKATTTADPWWTVDAYAKAGAGVTVGGCLDLWIKKWCLRLDKSAPNLIDATYRIAQAAGARPPMYAISNTLAGPRTQIEGIVVHPEPTSWTIGKYVDVGEDLHLTTGTNVAAGGRLQRGRQPGPAGVGDTQRPGPRPDDVHHDGDPRGQPAADPLGLRHRGAGRLRHGRGHHQGRRHQLRPGRWPPRQCGRRHHQQRRPAPDHALRPGHPGPAVRRARGPAPAGDGGAVGLRHLERRRTTACWRSWATTSRPTTAEGQRTPKRRRTRTGPAAPRPPGERGVLPPPGREGCSLRCCARPVRP